MAGNENKVVEYLYSNLGDITLNHIGVVEEVGNPDKDGYITNIDTYNELKSVKTQASLKKADIYINKKGISIKQKGGNFPYNRLQRAGIIPILEKLKIDNSDKILNRFDEEVLKYHKKERKSRNICWQDIFSESEFKHILKYLMMDGYPNKESQYKAELILEAPRKINSSSDISVFTFDEYFEEFKEKIVFSIRRQWVGQISDSEHKRALGLAKIIQNRNWVFDNIVGEPSGWREDFSYENRKTVYFLMIEKLK